MSKIGLGAGIRRYPGFVLKSATSDFLNLAVRIIDNRISNTPMEAARFNGDGNKISVGVRAAIAAKTLVAGQAVDGLLRGI